MSKHTEIKATKFGVVAYGMQFKFKGDNRVWFVGANRSAYTFAADGNTRATLETIPFNETVFVNLNTVTGCLTGFDD